jgi:hypothetical protein
MAHIRIRCRLPKPIAAPIEQRTPGGPYPLINGLVASWQDVEVHLIEDDGTERAWCGVQSVEWSSRADDNGPVTAKVELLNVEIDVVAEVERHPLAARIFDIVADSDSWSHYDADPTPEQREDVVRRIQAALEGKIGTVE